MASEQQQSGSGNAVIVAIWAAVLLTVFAAFRSDDLLKLPSLIGRSGGGPLAGAGIIDPIVGAVAAGAVLISWFGLGMMVNRFLPMTRQPGDSHVLEIAKAIAAGSILWSLVWFFLGLAGAYSTIAAVVVTIIGIVLAVIGIGRLRAAKDESRTPEPATMLDRILLLLAAASVALAFIACLAPPIAKDTLLYHFAVPKAFIAQHSSAVIEGNIASYLALGTEMHVVWAMLIGGVYSVRAGEAAAGATVFLFFPVLIAAVFGWARELNIQRTPALLAAATVAVIPTAFHVASSGYIDLTLALYVTLGVYAFERWRKTSEISTLIFAAIFLGGALAVKLTAVFVFAALLLVLLVAARGESSPGKLIGYGVAAMILAGVIASPWYLRDWATTGSPMFPFYMSVWKGTAPGWDVERSALFQMMNSQYGGAADAPVNYLTAPLRFSLAAQPEDARLYDGVLGASFLIGLPLVIAGFWRRKLSPSIAAMAAVIGVVYLFWLFSSPQLRYLLPIAPLAAIVVAATIDSFGDGALRKVSIYALAASSVLCVATSFAWFCQKAPLRVVLGGETREQYLARDLDYYPFYEAMAASTEPDAKTWLVNMRRDTYNVERPVISDYLFEDWTLRKFLWESRTVDELRQKASSLGAKYVLARHDFLFDYDRSSLVDDKRPRAENEAKLAMAKTFLLDPSRVLKQDGKFSLVKVN